MTEMQSDTATVAMDTQTADDTEAVADDNLLSPGEDRPSPAIDVLHSAGDTAHDVGDADNVVMQADESNTDSQHPVSSTGDDLTASRHDADDVSTGVPTPSSGQSSSSASVRITLVL